jgi:hypothetical protein
MSIDHPGLDVVEVSIFGPGKGESILLHLGNDQWIIVDSCVDRSDGSLPVLNYLHTIGVDTSNSVKMIVGTHAHDDHIAGISRLLEACSSAVFVSSSAVTSEEFFSVVGADEEIESFLRKSSYSEYRRIFEIIEQRGRSGGGMKPMRLAMENVNLFPVGPNLGELDIRLLALSPSSEAVFRAHKALARAFAMEGQRRRLAMADPNEFAIALWVEVNEKRLLLGADLLTGPAGCGWNAILATFTPDRRASLFKIPHHGAPNAHHPEVWTRLLEESPIALLAPYRAGRNPRPSREDRERICALTPKAFISAGADVPARSKAVQKAAASMSQLASNVREPDGRIGQVRARSKLSIEGWEVDIFRPAKRLCD